VRLSVKAALLGALLAVPAQAVLASPADGVFKGQYVCGAGPGGMTVALTPNGGNALHAVVHFYSLPHRNNVPDGSYETRGHYVPGQRKVMLKFADWIKQPPGYAAENLRALLSVDGQHLTGRLTSTSDCRTLNLQRRR
jgi:hypothetical protein